MHDEYRPFDRYDAMRQWELIEELKEEERDERSA